MPLYELTAARGTSVAVSGTDVYVAGFYTNTSGKQAAVYWKNGTLVPLHDTATGNAQAKAIAVSGTNVYVAGWVDEGTKSAVVWKNGTPTTSVQGGHLRGAGGGGVGLGRVRGGYYADLGEGSVVLVEERRLRGRLTCTTTNFSRANGITVSGSDVYAAGYYLPVPARRRPATGRTERRACSRETWRQRQATSVLVSGTDVYAAGYYMNANGNQAGGVLEERWFWSTCTATRRGRTMPGRFRSSCADGVIYTAGWVNEGTQVACYWKDLARVDLYPSGTSLASSLGRMRSPE